mmetsp:Transcript_15310/g.27518  ORF Transcript_15310/g.27518 Transcript_15310/m.27518 type:complete len:127 (-) Transcript_15310:242-622(-)
MCLNVVSACMCRVARAAMAMLLGRLRSVARFAKGKKGKGKKVAGGDQLPAGPLKMECFQLFAADEIPTAKPDNEYPEWLFKLAEPRPTITYLELNYDNLNYGELTQYFRWKRREFIRQKNAESLQF